MQIAFTKALEENIIETFTYSYATNSFLYDGKEDDYDPIATFIINARQEPFDTFMKLEGYGFKNALRAIKKYGFRYTPEQYNRAKVRYEIIELMKKECSDCVHYHVDETQGTGIVRVEDPHVYTTTETLTVHNFMQRLPKRALTNNLIYREKIDRNILKTPEQMDAIELCLTYRTSCLIGGAGTGKSTVTSAIIDQLYVNDLSVTILAPTHKARQQLQNKLKKGNVRTIHSYMYNPTQSDVIVIDEAGMMSTPMLAKIIKHHKPEQQLIFVGDKNQLEPIDYGRPFEQLQTLFPTATLKANHRSEAKDIICLAREIIGEPYNKNIALENIEQVATVKEAFNRGAQVLLTYTNKARVEANDQQKRKSGQPAIYPEWRVGDEILAKTNVKHRHYNGQLFTITAYNEATAHDTHETIRFRTPYELQFNFDLAYGLTIHKSQGSEWDVVAYQPSDRDTQNLAYVAVTRAKKKLIIVGNLPSEFQPKKEWKHL